jgi:predicted ATP-grasp superfamily ATP-dependent carboligase
LNLSQGEFLNNGGLNPKAWDFTWPILILATSGRALAQSAAASGYRVLVADCYADRETRQAASAWARIPFGADSEHWHHAITQLIGPELNSVGLVFGSGFENRPGLIEELSQQGILLGNTSQCIRLLKDPGRFFPLLQKLEIPAPETRLIPPDNLSGWLQKTIGGTGGHHVLAATTSTTINCYYQRRLKGQPGSVLFLTNGKEAQILGYNCLETAPTSTASYRYGGVSTPLELAPSICTLLQRYLNDIVSAIGLRGLNGLDFIQGPAGEIQVLEINPRPPASLDLYQDLFNPFDAHIKACLGGPLPVKVTPMTTARAFSILYAPHRLQVFPNMIWPTFCHDYPIANYFIGREEPICSVHATGSSIEECQQLIKQRQSQVLRLLTLS